MKRKLLLLFAFIPFLYGCPSGGEAYVRLINQSEQDIYVYLSYDEEQILPQKKKTN